MNDQERVKALLKEAMVYKNQGLFRQAGEKFNSALEIASRSDELKTNKALAEAIRQRLRDLEAALKEVDEDDEVPELSEDVQDLIRKSFAFSKDREAAAMEGAMALAKFGQFEKALEEFNRILEYATLPFVVAKNILRCRLNMSPPEEAVREFKTWSEGERFSPEELLRLRDFLGGLLKARGLEPDLPDISDKPAPTPEAAPAEDEEMDISSVNIRVRAGPEVRAMEFPVELQSKNTVSIVVKSSDRELVNLLRHGLRLPGLQCFSSMGFFPAAGTVTGKTKVLQGPNRGHFMVDIRLDD
jgi:tetratricopeptide (TPR) repeat protein